MSKDIVFLSERCFLRFVRVGNVVFCPSRSDDALTIDVF